MWRILPVVLEATESDADIMHAAINEVREAATNGDLNLLGRSHNLPAETHPEAFVSTPGC